MANHASAIKRHRQSLKRATRNQAIRSRVRTLVKKARTHLEAGEKEAAKEATREAQKALHRAASKGVLHPKNAARRISRLARQADGLGQ